MIRTSRVRELTASGRGAIRVLVLEGPGACERLAPLLGGQAVAIGSFAPVLLREPDGSLLDEAIVLVESATRVELHLHGSPALMERVRRWIPDPGSEEPEPSLEERAERRLESSASELAARILLDQAEGALRGELVRLLAGDDTALLRGARALGERGRRAHWLLTPPRVVLAGPVNAGKSTLFNLLVGRERVIVSADPGTTRDAVRERVRLGNLAVDLFDTAGTRALPQEARESGVERAGQDLARQTCATADLVLWLVPAGRDTPPPALRSVRVLHTLGDLGHGAGQPGGLSALRAPEEARRIVERTVQEALGVSGEVFGPGVAVPFEEEQTSALSGEPADSLRRVLAHWLSRSSSD